jgi:DNA-binding MarR family transcriptional regulator
MSKIHPSYMTLLEKFVSYKILTVKQLALLCDRSLQATRRSVRELIKKELLSKDDKFYTNRPGRREELLFLTLKGSAILQNIGLIDDVQFSEQEQGFAVDHEILLNWFHIHLREIVRIHPHLSLQSGSQNRFLTTDSNPSTEIFIPDGVFSLFNESENKALLFFLEVDMGTESFGSASANASTIERKILNYQEYFYAGRYKEWQESFGCKFNGFRLLVLANEFIRHSKLCKRVAVTPPNNFIWLTDQAKMFEGGLGDAIWTAAGNRDKPLQSILGSMACATPLQPSL